MYAKVTAKPALRLREQPDAIEINRMPFDSTVLVLNWESHDAWACVQYHGIRGYAKKEFLRLVEDSEVNKDDIQTAQEPFLHSDINDSWTFSSASGYDRPYIVMQVTLKEKLLGTGSGNLIELENVINHFAARGYRLHTMATSESSSKGAFLGDRIQATLVFEKKSI